MEVLFLFYFFLFFPMVIKSNQEDPCSDKVYKEIPDLPRRNPSYYMDSAPLCDYHLSYGWYRGEYSQIPTSPPSLAYCGTLYPIWLNGQHPPVNSTSILDACKVGFASDCVYKIEIEVKNCNTYMVYKLHPVGSCNSAYCFDYLTTMGVTTSSESTMSSQTSVHSTKEQIKSSRKKESPTTVPATPDNNFSTKETTLTAVLVSKSKSQGTQNNVHTTGEVSILTTAMIKTLKTEPLLTTIRGTTVQLQTRKETNRPVTISQTSKSVQTTLPAAQSTSPFYCISSTTTKMITESTYLRPVLIAIVSSVVAICLTIIIVSVICCRKMSNNSTVSPDC